MLQLARPLVFFDLETTGVDLIGDRIVEIALLIVSPSGEKKTIRHLVNPLRPIPPEATAIHGITDDMVKNEKPFKDIAPELLSYFSNVDVGGYNVFAFDIPFLQKEFERCGLSLDTNAMFFVDPMTIFKRKEPRDLTAAYAFYCGKELKNAHSALADIEATYEVLLGQLDTYADLPSTPQNLHAFCDFGEGFVDTSRKFKWHKGEAILAFGQHRGKTLKQLAKDKPDYLQWMSGKADFASDVKTIAINSLKGIFPEKKN